MVKATARVLNISEARPALPELVRRAVDDGAEIHIGRDRRDEVALIAANRLRELQAAYDALHALGLGSPEAVQAALAADRPRGKADPFASLRQVVRERAGALEVAAGRRLVATSTDGPEEDRERDGMTWHTMAALGAAPAPAAAPRRKKKRG